MGQINGSFIWYFFLINLCFCSMRWVWGQRYQGDRLRRNQGEWNQFRWGLEGMGWEWRVQIIQVFRRRWEWSRRGGGGERVLVVGMGVIQQELRWLQSWSSWELITSYLPFEYCVRLKAAPFSPSCSEYQTFKFLLHTLNTFPSSYIFVSNNALRSCTDFSYCISRNLNSLSNGTISPFTLSSECPLVNSDESMWFLVKYPTSLMNFLSSESLLGCLDFLILYGLLWSWLLSISVWSMVSSIPSEPRLLFLLSMTFTSFTIILGVESSENSLTSSLEQRRSYWVELSSRDCVPQEQVMVRMGVFWRRRQ